MMLLTTAALARKFDDLMGRHRILNRRSSQL